MATVADFYRAIVKPEMQQFGVKGMRWGVRKPRNAGPGPASKASPPPAKPGKRTKKSPRRPLADLSEQELTKQIKRLELEQRYRQLTATPPKGGDVVKSELKKIAKQQAINIGSRAATIAVAQAFGLAAKKTTNPQLAQILTQLGGAQQKKKK